jgi:hypothetical protein
MGFDVRHQTLRAARGGDGARKVVPYGILENHEARGHASVVGIGILRHCMRSHPRLRIHDESSFQSGR